MSQDEESVSESLQRLSEIDLARIKQIFANLGITATVVSQTRDVQNGSYRVCFVLELPIATIDGSTYEFTLHRFYDLAMAKMGNIKEALRVDPADVIVPWLRATGAELPYTDAYLGVQ